MLTFARRLAKMKFGFVGFAGFAAATALLGISSCGKDPGYVFWEPLREADRVEREVFVRELTLPTIDILWVIDNSGSMSTPQSNVINNTRLFMDEFTKFNIPWKMGLISTGSGEAPYIGFTPTTRLTSDTPNAAAVFQDAVGRLGLYGSGIEKTFEPILDNLRKYPDFLRQNTPLAVIMVTDATEQSNISVTDFVTQLRATLGTRQLYAYGVYNANDLGPGCNGESGGDGPWYYAGSRWEEFIKQADAGGVYPMCAPDFGAQLSSLGNQIARRVSRTAIYLNHRPKVPSIRVTYGNQVLPGGFPEQGGYWVYDVGDNAVVFHNLDFSTNPNDKVGLTYEKDDGYPVSGQLKKDTEDGWYEVPLRIESDHPYANSANTVVPLAVEGAQAFKFYFDYLDTESGCDFVKLLGPTNTPVQSLHGRTNNFWSNEIPGDRVTIQFTSDSSVVREGYVISKVAFKLQDTKRY